MSDLVPAADFAATNTTRHPNESESYRRSRQNLLVQEIELRRQIERVAQLRRELPLGGEVSEDFASSPRTARMCRWLSCSATIRRW